MDKIKVMSIFGTRPEGIKMAPVIKEIEQRDDMENIVVVTGQHREMLDQVLEVFNIKPDFDLNIMKGGQTLGDITTNVMINLDKVIKETKPDIILVHGDTTTTFAAGVTAFYNQTAIGHVEAGLRTYNKYSPYPEEMNRQLTDVLADLYFAPTSESKDNLLKENHSADKIYVTGNTAIDALKHTVVDNYDHKVLDGLDKSKRTILVTMHRRENQGEPMRQVFTAINEVVNERNDVQVIYPVHLNPTVQSMAKEVLGNNDNIHLIDPLDVVDFHNIASKSHFIMSDSGGVQEEAPSLGKPVLVLRDTTERPEGVAAGTLKLVGTNYEEVKANILELLDDTNLYQKMSEAKNPYGDGHASARIADAIAKNFEK